MSKLKVMVVGAGALGRHHARILSTLPGVELVAVADPRESIGRGVAEAHGSQWIPDFQAAIDTVDAASIVVPTSLHLPVAREFLQRGIPVLVEKPLAGNVTDAEQLVALADAQNTILQVGHVERFNPAMKAARRVYGQPRYIRAERVSPFPFRSTDISVVHDVMIHDIDLVLDLVKSPVTRVESFGIGMMGAGADIATARLYFESGCIADLTASRLNPTSSRMMHVWSPIGCVAIDFQARTVTNYSPSEALLFGPSPVEQASRPGADVERLKQDVFGKFLHVKQLDVVQEDALTAELSEFTHCVQDGSQPSCAGHAALAALKVADQVLQSINAHQWAPQPVHRAA